MCTLLPKCIVLISALIPGTRPPLSCRQKGTRGLALAADQHLHMPLHCRTTALHLGQGGTSTKSHSLLMPLSLPPLIESSGQTSRYPTSPLIKKRTCKDIQKYLFSLDAPPHPTPPHPCYISHTGSGEHPAILTAMAMTECQALPAPAWEGR